MIDQYGRTIEYLRISVTDRCNLRCVYCMPEEGIEQLPHEQILTFDEIERVCRISTELGISKIKLTGGEPLVGKSADLPVGRRAGIFMSNGAITDILRRFAVREI